VVRKAGFGLSIALIGAVTLLPYVAGFPGAYLQMVLALLLVGWLAMARPPIEVGPEGWCLLVAVALLAGVFAVNGTIAYTANFLMLVLAVPLASALRAQAAAGNTQLVARMALVGVAVAALLALFQVVIQGRARAAGLASDEIWSAVAASVLGWLALIGRLNATGLWRHLYLLGPVLGTLVILLSGSRGPMLAIPLLFGVAFAMMPGHRRGLLIALAAVVALFIFWPDKSRMASVTTIGKEIAAGVPLTDGSFDVRKVLLDAGWAAFKLSPWTGYGWGNFAQATAPWTGVTDWTSRSDAFHLHSDPLNFAVAGGIVGLASYLLILAAPVVGAWKTPPDTHQQARRLGAALLAATYAGCGLTNTFFGFEMHTALYACLIAVLFGFCRDQPAGPKT
jgi:O-antigen ligase